MAGKVILLAGASGGIGAALSTMFPGDTLVRHGFSHASGSAFVQADVTDAASVDRAVAEVLERHGRIDVLVNAAGVNIDGFAHKVDPEAARKVLDTNVLGSIQLIRAVLPGMRAQGFGRIVLLGSVVGHRPAMGTSVYAASKAALTGLAKAVAVENATKNVTCNVLALGYMEAGMLHRIPEAIREQIRQSIPMQRFGQVEEVKSSIEYLIAVSYVTGQTIHCNGGLYAD